MFNQRYAAARAVAEQLLPAERVVDEAIVHNAKLAIAVVEGRRSANLPLTTGQKGLDLVVQANVRLCEARGLLADAHQAFRTTQAEVGLKATSWGDLQPCPPSSGEEREPAPLSLVG